MDKTAETLIDVSGFISEYSAHMMGCGVQYFTSDTQCQSHWGIIRLYGKNQCHSEKEKTRSKSKYINWLLITIVAVLLGSMVVELVQNV